MPAQPVHASPLQQSNSNSSQEGFDELWQEALARYKDETKKDLPKLLSAQSPLSQLRSSGEIIHAFDDGSDAFKIFRSNGHKTRRVLKKIVHFAGLFLDVAAEGASSHMPGGSGKAIFVAVGVLLQTTKGVSDLYDAVETLLRDVPACLERIHTYLRALPSLNDSLRTILLETLVQVLHVLAFVTKYCKEAVESRSRTAMLKVFKRVASRRIKDYFFVLCGNTDVKDALKKLEALAMKEQRTATADIHMDVRNVQSEVVEILDITVNNDLHSWLDPPTQRSIDDEKKRPQDSSCRWFFDDDEFKNWKACDNGIYWVYGNVGAGKSVLCSSAIETLKASSDMFVAYYYFDYKDIKKQGLRGLLASLVFQVGTHFQGCLTYLREQRLSYSLGDHPTNDALLDMLSHILPMSGPTALFIDALDECPRTARENLTLDLNRFLRIICDSTGDVLRLRLLITSRPEADIEDYMSHFATHVLDIQNDSQHKSELDFHISSQLSYMKPLGWSDDTKAKVHAYLLEKANGLFPWVDLKLEQLKHCTQSDVDAVLKYLPSDLFKTYERILDSFPLERLMINRARRVFECIASAKRPLYVAEVAHILSSSFDAPAAAVHPKVATGSVVAETVGHTSADIDSDLKAEILIRSTCPALLDIISEKGSKVVRFIHFSFQEYLMSPRLEKTSSPIGLYWFTNYSANLTLAKICISALLDESYSKSFPYADTKWHEHVSSRNEDDIWDLLTRFLHPNSPAFKCWGPDRILSYTATIRVLHGPKGASTFLFRPQDEYMTALHWAAKLGLAHYVIQLTFPDTISSISLRARGTGGQTALHLAADEGHAEVVRILLDCDAHVGFIADMMGFTPLHRAVRNGHLDVVNILLENPAPSRRSRRGALNSLKILCWRLLIGSGWIRILQCRACDCLGRTAFHRAAQSGHLGIVCILLQYGTFGMEDVDYDGNTALHLATVSGHADVARILLENGALVSHVDDDGRTPLHLAVLNGHLNVLTVLLECSTAADGPDGTARLCGAGDLEGQTPLHAAVISGRIDLCRVLLDHGAPVDVRDDSGHTPISLVQTQLGDDRQHTNIRVQVVDPLFGNAHWYYSPGHLERVSQERRLGFI